MMRDRKCRHEKKELRMKKIEKCPAVTRSDRVSFIPQRGKERKDFHDFHSVEKSTKRRNEVSCFCFSLEKNNARTWKYFKCFSSIAVRRKD
jgi:hypothetical protein